MCVCVCVCVCVCMYCLGQKKKKKKMGKQGEEEGGEKGKQEKGKEKRGEGKVKIQSGGFEPLTFSMVNLCLNHLVRIFVGYFLSAGFEFLSSSPKLTLKEEENIFWPINSTGPSYICE